MVEVLVDERTVGIEGDMVVFRYNNVQEYTKEQAKNVYAGMLLEKFNKEKVIEDYNNNIKTMEEELDKQINKMFEKVKDVCNDISDSQLNTWKKVQLRLSKHETNLRIDKLREDIMNINEGLNIWSCCKDLPDTEHSIKMMEVVNADRN